MIKLLKIIWGHIVDFATRAPELYTDTSDRSLSHTRIGMILAGAVFTFKMLHDLPEGWEMWATYMGTVGGYAIARQMVASRNPLPNKDAEQ